MQFKLLRKLVLFSFTLRPQSSIIAITLQWLRIEESLTFKELFCLFCSYEEMIVIEAY